MPSPDFDTAKLRGKRAEKLFNKDSVMEAVIVAMKTGDYAGFDAACKEAIKPGDDPGIAAPSDVDNFIADLWAAACSSRARHESKPCW